VTPKKTAFKGGLFLVPRVGIFRDAHGRYGQAAFCGVLAKLNSIAQNVQNLGRNGGVPATHFLASANALACRFGEVLVAPSELLHDGPKAIVGIHHGP